MIKAKVIKGQKLEKENEELKKENEELRNQLTEKNKETNSLTNFLEDYLGLYNSDIEMIEKVNWSEIDAEDIRVNLESQTVAFNDVIIHVLYQARDFLNTEINDSISYFEDLPKDLRIANINVLEDIDFYVNGFDTHVYIKNEKESVYKKYFSSELAKMESITGIEI